MIEDIVDPTAVFDPAAVGSLTGDPDDGAFGAVLVERYRRLLPGRVRRVAATLAAGDPDDALDAVRSLRVSSATVGAHELAGIATRIERLVRRGDVTDAVLAETGLLAAARRADTALAGFLGTA